MIRFDFKKQLGGHDLIVPQILKRLTETINLQRNFKLAIENAIEQHKIMPH